MGAVSAALLGCRRLLGFSPSARLQRRFRRRFRVGGARVVVVALAWVVAGVVAVAVIGCGRRPAAVAPVRVAVIGGMTMTGLWQEVAAAFTSRSGIPVEVVATGPKEVLDEAFRAGGIDLVTLHSSDTATNLVADGLAINLRPWARNELVIVGPTADPAGIRGLRDGAAALRKIAAAGAPYVGARNVGSQTVAAGLWRKAGIEPAGDWLLKDESPGRQGVVAFAAARRAYVIVGRIPILWGKLAAAAMEIMVEGDPEMRRPYVVLEANPAAHLGRNPDGARRLADFMTSPEGQAVLRGFAARQDTGLPVFYPVAAE